MLKIIMLRHFATAGNLKKRYIGSTDEPLCREGIGVKDSICYPQTEAVFISPLLRCKETARLIYPEIIPVVCEDFRECDFGDFENKNYRELSGNPKYQEWIDSNATLPFPGGEHPEAFKQRTLREFERLLELCQGRGYRTIALIVHGGTIMSILERYAFPKEDYYHWLTDNGKGYIAELNEKEGRIISLCSIQ